MTDKFTLFTTIRGSVLRQTTIKLGVRRYELGVYSFTFLAFTLLLLNHIFTILLGARAMKLASFAE